MIRDALGRVGAWVGDRWPVAALAKALVDEEIPGGARVTYSLGSALLFVFGLQVFTGIAQLLFYAPTVDHAYASVSYLRTEVPFGWLLHGLHYWGAQAMVVLALLHLAQVFVWGAYKRPRELTWLVGVGLLLVTMGFSFTGGPLPWDQKGYWAAVVGTSVPGTIPLIGNAITGIMLGGGEMGQLALGRFFALHTLVLPLTLLLLVGVHVVAVRRAGAAGPWRDEPGAPGPFWPGQAFRDTLAAAAVFLLLAALAALLPPPYQGPADPLDFAYVPKPEWNFLFLYQALKHFKGPLEPLGVLGVPAAVFGLLAAFPFLDRGASRNPFRRPLAMALGIGLAATLAGLSVAGHLSPGFQPGTPAGIAAPGTPTAPAAAAPATPPAPQPSTTPAAPGDAADGKDPGGGGIPAAARPGAAAGIIGNTERGATLFARMCTGCHGDAGGGGVRNPGSADGTVPTLVPVARNLFSPDAAAFAASLDTFLQHGSTPAGSPAIRMPAFGDSRTLTQPQIANLEAFLLDRNGVDRGGPTNPGLRPATFLVALLGVFLLAALALAGAWGRILGREECERGPSPPGGEGGAA